MTGDLRLHACTIHICNDKVYDIYSTCTYRGIDILRDVYAIAIKRSIYHKYSLLAVAASSCDCKQTVQDKTRLVLKGELIY